MLAFNKSIILAFALLTILTACSALQPKDATTAAISHAANSEWPSFGRDYSNQRFSPLDQVNRDNVAKLVPAWHYKSGVAASFQTTPVVVDGVM
jgi:glucose dehydrogenase